MCPVRDVTEMTDMAQIKKRGSGEISPELFFCSDPAKRVMFEIGAVAGRRSLFICALVENFLVLVDRLTRHLNSDPLHESDIDL